MLTVAVCTLAAEVVGVPALRVPARAAFLCWLLLSLAATGRAERLFLAVSCAVSALVAATVPDAASVLARGLDQAGIFLTFVAVLNLLRDAAYSSVAIRRGGDYLINQSPPRRYAALTLGCHVMAIALNMGALNLLGALVVRSNTLAAAGGDARIVAIRERRMMTALLRGFGSVLMWTPLGVNVAYTLALVPSLTWFHVAPIGIALGLAWMALGWIIDRVEWPPSARAAALVRKDVPAREVVPVLGITALLVAGVLGAKLALGASLLAAVMVSVPPMAALWIALQYRRAGPSLAAAAALRRLRRHARDLLPQTRPEIILLASAAYIGVGASAALSAGGLGPAVTGLQVPAPVLATAIFVLVSGGALIGITPLVSVTVLGTVLGTIEPAPLPPLALAIALQSGWAMSSITSPFSGGSLILARVVGKGPFEFQRWNWAFGLTCTALMAALFAVWLG